MKLKPTSQIRIDRHKVAAILTIAFTEKNFLKFSCNIKETNEIERYANIYLGFLLGKSIIKDFYEKDKKNQDKDAPILNISDNSYMEHFKKLIFNLLQQIILLSYQLVRQNTN